MSENAVTIVELSLDQTSACARAATVREWLLSSGVVQVNVKRDDLWQPSEFRAGPNVLRAASAWGLDEAHLANNGVDLVVKREVHHPFENFEAPSCPECSAPLEFDDERHSALVMAWLGGQEPEVPCSRCGRSARLGDWPGQWMFAVGNLAVRFNNWPPLREEFLSALRVSLGPRTRVVFQHS